MINFIIKKCDQRKKQIDKKKITVKNMTSSIIDSYYLLSLLYANQNLPQDFYNY